MYPEQGYKAIGVNACSILRRCAERTARHAVVKATLRPIKEPAQNVPREVTANKTGVKERKNKRKVFAFQRS